MVTNAAVPEVRVGVGVIITAGTKILLAKRINSHGNGTWTAPGGHLDFNESVLACAVRETREESGLELDPQQIIELGYTEDIFLEENKHYVTCFVACHVDVGCSPKRMEPKKFETAWEWFDVFALPQPLFVPVRNVLRKFGGKVFPEMGVSRALLV